MADEKRPNVTQEEVDLAYKAFRDRNEHPSVREMQKAVGGGSNGTISKMLKVAETKYKEVRTTTLSLPPDLQQVILLSMDREVQAAKLELESSLARAKENEAFLADDNERQTAEIRQLQEKISVMDAKLQQQIGVNQALEMAKQDAQRLVAETKRLADEEIEKIKAEADREIQAAAQATEHVRKEANEVRSKLAKADLRLEGLPRLEEEIKRLQGEFKTETEARHRAERAKAVSDTRVEELQGYRDQAEALAKQLDDVKRELSEANAKIAGQGAELAAGKKCEEDLIRYRSEAEKLRVELTTARDQHQKGLDELRQGFEAARKTLQSELDATKNEQVRTLARLVSESKADSKGEKCK